MTPPGPTVAIIQARLGSQRLPGKVLATVAGRSLLDTLLDQLSFCETLDQVVVAIPAGEKDAPIARLCAGRRIRCVAGPEEDVLTRYVMAAGAAGAETVLRITADCPLLDAGTVDRNVTAHLAGGWEYSYNDVPETVPRGYDVEVFSRTLLSRLDALSDKPEEREHVTFHIERHPERFSVNRFQDERFPPFPDVRLCVDTEEDLAVVSRILESAGRPGEPLTPEAVRAVLAAHPELCHLNAAVRQKDF